MTLSIPFNDGFVSITAAGGETTLTGDFPIYDKDHVRIIETDLSGNDTTLARGTDYSIADGELEDAAGFEVVMDTGEYPSGLTAGFKYALILDVPEERTTDFSQGGDFKAATLNRELDLFAQITQGLRRDVDKGIRFPDSSTISAATILDPTGNADKIVVVNSTADGFAYSTNTLANIDTYLATLSPIAADITAVAAIDTEVTTVAGISSAVSTVAGNITAIQDAANNIPKPNYAATTAPTVGDDTADGYTVGSVWIDTTADKIYLCVDASLGAAVWIILPQGIADLADVASTSPSGGDLLVFNNSNNRYEKQTISGDITLNENGVATFTGKAGGLTHESITTTSSLSSETFNEISGSSLTVTVPTAVGREGDRVFLQHNGTSLTNVYTVNSTSGQTIGGLASGAFKLYTNGEILGLISDGANWLILARATNTDWTSAGALSFAGGTPPSKPAGANILDDEVRWKRNGKNATIEYLYRHNAVGTTGTGDYRLDLPTGMSFSSEVKLDTAAMGSLPTVTQLRAIIGNGYVRETSASGDVQPVAYDSTTFRCYNFNKYTNSNVWSSTYYDLNIATFCIYIRLEVEIDGWQP